jgi:penicillin-binding protein 2
MITAVATGGTLIPPHLLKDAQGLRSGSFPISDGTVEQMTDAMWGVVNEPDGTTSGTVKLVDVDFAGKTGTAQTESFALQARLGKHIKENGWFIGFAPRRNPEIVVAALVQGAGWGSSVAPIVRDVVKAYYDKKEGHFQLPPAPQTAGAPAVRPPAAGGKTPPAAAKPASAATQPAKAPVRSTSADAQPEETAPAHTTPSSVVADVGAGAPDQ